MRQLLAQPIGQTLSNLKIIFYGFADVLTSLNWFIAACFNKDASPVRLRRTPVGIRVVQTEGNPLSSASK